MMTIKSELRPDMRTILSQPIMKKKILIYIKKLLEKVQNSKNNIHLGKQSLESLQGQMKKLNLLQYIKAGD
jgi:hypothetical protein